jgi:hypothetical protein
MHPICWLHISDIHMRVSKVWSQDVLLNATCEDIAKQRQETESRSVRLSHALAECVAVRHSARLP